MRAGLATAGWATVYAGTVYLGRLTRFDVSPLALVWPAAAVGLLWLAWSWHDRRRVAVDAAALGVLAGIVNVLTGSSPTMGLVFGVANVVQALAACALLVTLQRRWGTTRWRLRRSADLGALVIASFGGSVVAACIGPVGLWALQGADLPTTALAWILRNAASTFVFAALALRVADRALPRAVRSPREGWELCAAALVVVSCYAAVFGLPWQLPFAFLLVPLSMWLGLRFDTTVASAHVLLTGVLVVSLTIAGRGPFAVTDPWVRVLLAQAFVTVTGLVALVLALHRDERQRLITGLEQARAEADEQARLVAEAAARTSAFLATMSHEIRTPLNGVLGLTRLLLGSALDAQQRAWAAAADRSGAALLHIVNDVLDTAKIEAGALDLEDVDLDLLDLLDEAVLPLRAAADDRGLSLVVAPAPGLRTARSGDPTRVRQVVTNLVANAVKFTERGSVTVTADGDDRGVVLTVTDTGIGMTPEQLDRVFTPFRQADASTTRHYGGTGLGLSITAGLAQRMGGTITASSTPGIGTSLRVELPLPTARGVRVRVPDPATVATVPAGLEGVAVLVAEDNEVNQMVARATLEARGLRVDVVGDGAAAVEATLTGDYAAVLMDCRMPVVDGMEATRRIRAAEQAGGRWRTPVIAMTASALLADQQRYREAGMDDVLPKPWTPAQLDRALDLVRAAAAVDAVLEPGTSRGDLAGVRARLDELFEDVDPAEAAPVRRTMVESLLTRTPQLIATLEIAATQDDRAAVREAAHALRGMFATVGATELAALAGGLEQRTRRDDAVPADRLATVAALGEAFARLAPGLRELTAAGAGDRPAPTGISR